MSSMSQNENRGNAVVSVGSDGLLGILASLETSAVRVRPRQCTRLRHRKASCTRCVDVCPTGAITWAPMALEVDAGKCSSCGLCVAVCPTGALEGKSPSNTELVGKARDLAKARPTVAFACKKHLRSIGSAADGCIQISCIGRLDESILVGSVAWGARELQLVDGDCEQCADARGHSIAEKAMERSRLILDAFESSASIAFAPSLPAEMRSSGKNAPSGVGVSRRGFFGFLAGRAKQTGSIAAEAVLPSVILAALEEKKQERPLNPGELPVYQPVRRRLLLAALARLGSPTRSGLAGEEGFWTDFRITNRCTGCRSCAVFCPTGALSKTGEGDQPALSFRISQCTGCLVCRDLCVWKAVMLPLQIDLASVMADSTTTIPIPKTDDAY